ncbi:MAG: hypothetical protein U0796_02115 [Gemmatales bacterium]
MSKPLLHVGPVMPGWGSWEWLGQELIPEWQQSWDVSTFDYDQEPPTHGTLVLIKHPPPAAWWERARQANRRSVYAPVDHYGSVAEIDQQAGWLSQLDHIVVHSPRLQRYFTAYSEVSYLDHHWRFVTPDPVTPQPEGPILWVGVHTNLEPLVAWLHEHPLPAPLLVLTNTKDLDPVVHGFPASAQITMQTWTPANHLDALRDARGAIDVKGDDFRQRHKPSTKAIDYVISGLPLAMPGHSSSVERLNFMGLNIPEPTDLTRWFSPEYLQAIHAWRAQWKDPLSRATIAQQWMKYF